MLQRILDLIYPPSCHLCQAPLEDGSYLCADCHDTAHRIDHPYCETCSEAFDGAIDGAFDCPNCHQLRFDFDFARSALKNSESNRKLILDLKYLKQRHLTKTLAGFCADAWHEDPRFSDLPNPALVPVPLHWRRKLKRGFNQAAEIAAQLSPMIDVPMLDILRRSRNTTTQTRLTRSQRLKNLRGAFSVKKIPVTFRSLVLIDDVFTTGSTVQACAATIKKQLPHLEKVVVLTAMRG